MLPVYFWTCLTESMSNLMVSSIIFLVYFELSFISFLLEKKKKGKVYVSNRDKDFTGKKQVLKIKKIKEKEVSEHILTTSYVASSSVSSTPRDLMASICFKVTMTSNWAKEVNAPTELCVQLCCCLITFIILVDLSPFSTSLRFSITVSLSHTESHRVTCCGYTYQQLRTTTDWHHDRYLTDGSDGFWPLAPLLWSCDQTPESNLHTLLRWQRFHRDEVLSC